METTIQVLRNMVKENVIANYAIGGAMALTFYIEPTLTYDLDVFVFLPRSESSGLLLNLQPIYDYCRLKQYPEKHEHIIIDGIAVQFIPVYNQLVEEAVNRAKRMKYGQTPVRVLSLEYLMAIMLKTGRPKDYSRLVQILSESKVNKRVLNGILSRHGLKNAWQSFCKKFQ